MARVFTPDDLGEIADRCSCGGLRRYFELKRHAVLKRCDDCEEIEELAAVTELSARTPTTAE